MLLELLAGDATEAELIRVAGDPSQATAHRRLASLQGLGLIERAGGWRAPNRPWKLAHPRDIESLLSSAIELADTLARAEQAKRDESREKARRARENRAALRTVEGRTRE